MIDGDLFTKKLMTFLKDSREIQSISVKEMADCIGITENHLKALEKGEVNVNLSIFIAYCDKLNFDYGKTIDAGKMLALEDENE